MAFIRILSPNNAPPVLRLDGSTDINPMVSGKSIKNDVLIHLQEMIFLSHQFP
jgi:hypothetical protein